MLLLGWAVGTGSTPVDDGFARYVYGLAGEQPRWLLVFTEWRLLGPVLAACVATALYRRRWRTAVVVVGFPFLAVTIGQAFKRLFDRHNGAYLEYPSGHTMLAVSVMGMVVVVTGARLWALAAAITVSLLGALGLVACGYHYVTDTIGAALLASALAVVAARLAADDDDDSAAKIEHRGP